MPIIFVVLHTTAHKNSITSSFSSTEPFPPKDTHWYKIYSAFPTKEVPKLNPAVSKHRHVQSRFHWTGEWTITGAKVGDSSPMRVLVEMSSPNKEMPKVVLHGWSRDRDVAEWFARQLNSKKQGGGADGQGAFVEVVDLLE